MLDTVLTVAGALIPDALVRILFTHGLAFVLGAAGYRYLNKNNPKLLEAVASSVKKMGQFFTNLFTSIKGGKKPE